MRDLLSVIVPVYNTKEYLVRCFTSLRNQSYNNIQIIFVDDGSTDGSSEICDNFSKEFRNVKTIHTQNLGVSHARNIGIQNSDGSLIAFLDSDDYISPTFYSEFISRMPVFAFGSIVIDDGKKLKPIHELTMDLFIKSKDIKYFIVGDEEDENESYFEKTRIFGSVCRSVFSKKIITDNNLFFNENLTVGEDLIFLLNYLSYVDRITRVDAKYFYNRSCASATTFLCKGYLSNYLQKYKELTDSLVLCISNYEKNHLEKKRLIDYQKMKFVMGFTINEIVLSNKTNFYVLRNFFNEKSNKSYLKFSVKSIKSFEKISFKRKVLLILIKHRMWKIIALILRSK